MKATYHNGRATKDGLVFNANHNTNHKTRGEQKHIDHEKTMENVVWARDINNINSPKLIRQIGSFDAKSYELQFYKERYGAARERKNQDYIKSGHKADVRTMEQVIESKKTAPLETVFQIGKEGEHVSPEQLESIFKSFTVWMQQQYGNNLDILDVALHVDEATPHIHSRCVLYGRDKDGNRDINQTAAFKELGIERPDLTKKQGKYNCPLMTFTERNREKFYEICEEYGIGIDKEVKSKSQKHLDILEYKTQQEEEKAREAAQRAEAYINYEQELKEIQEAANRPREDTSKVQRVQVKDGAFKKKEVIQMDEETFQSYKSSADVKAIERRVERKIKEQEEAAQRLVEGLRNAKEKELEETITGLKEELRQAQSIIKEKDSIIKKLESKIAKFKEFIKEHNFISKWFEWYREHKERDEFYFQGQEIERD